MYECVYLLRSQGVVVVSTEDAHAGLTTSARGKMGCDKTARRARGRIASAEATRRVRGRDAHGGASGRRAAPAEATWGVGGDGLAMSHPLLLFITILLP